MKRNKQGGFTLIEIIVASTILLIGITMFATVVSRILHQNFLSHRHTQAVILAQNRIEFLLNDGYTSPNLNEGYYENPLNPVNETGDSNGVFTQIWDIEDVNPIEKALRPSAPTEIAPTPFPKFLTKGTTWNASPMA